jgi:hypothetical protein
MSRLRKEGHQGAKALAGTCTPVSRAVHGLIALSQTTSEKALNLLRSHRVHARLTA